MRSFHKNVALWTIAFASACASNQDHRALAIAAEEAPSSVVCESDALAKRAAYYLSGLPHGYQTSRPPEKMPFTYDTERQVIGQLAKRYRQVFLVYISDGFLTTRRQGTNPEELAWAQRYMEATYGESGDNVTNVALLTMPPGTREPTDPLLPNPLQQAIFLRSSLRPAALAAEADWYFPSVSHLWLRSTRQDPDPSINFNLKWLEYDAFLSEFNDSWFNHDLANVLERVPGSAAYIALGLADAQITDAASRVMFPASTLEVWRVAEVDTYTNFSTEIGSRLGIAFSPAGAEWPMMLLPLEMMSLGGSLMLNDVSFRLPVMIACAQLTGAKRCPTSR